MRVFPARRLNNPLVFLGLFRAAVALRLATPRLCRSTLTLQSARDQEPPDVEESNARDGVETPFGLLARGPPSGDKGREKSGDDHEDVGDDGQQRVIRRETGEDAERDEEERSGEQPVDAPVPCQRAGSASLEPPTHLA